jgi:steroid delta-isomerase-like uncharacterized protein
MSQSHHALAVRWMEEVWNDRNDATIDELLSPEAVGHAEGMPDICGPREFREFRSGLLNAFPDLRLDVQDTLCAGDNVVLRWRVRGHHRGAGLGLAASGRSVDFWGMTWLRFSNGRIVEGWDAWNQGGLMQRLAEQSPPTA